MGWLAGMADREREQPRGAASESARARKRLLFLSAAAAAAAVASAGVRAVRDAVRAPGDSLFSRKRDLVSRGFANSQYANLTQRCNNRNSGIC